MPYSTRRVHMQGCKSLTTRSTCSSKSSTSSSVSGARKRAEAARDVHACMPSGSRRMPLLRLLLVGAPAVAASAPCNAHSHSEADHGCVYGPAVAGCTTLRAGHARIHSFTVRVLALLQWAAQSCSSRSRMSACSACCARLTAPVTVSRQAAAHAWMAAVVASKHPSLPVRCRQQRLLPALTGTHATVRCAPCVHGDPFPHACHCRCGSAGLSHSGTGCSP